MINPKSRLVSMRRTYEQLDKLQNLFPCRYTPDCVDDVLSYKVKDRTGRAVAEVTRGCFLVSDATKRDRQLLSQLTMDRRQSLFRRNRNRCRQ